MAQPVRFNGSIALAALCALSIGLSAFRCAHVVNADVFAKAADAVKAEHEPNDLVVVLPYSQMTPRLLLPGYDLIELRNVDTGRLKDYGRIWLFDIDAIGRSQDQVDAVMSVGSSSAIVDEGHLRLVRVDIKEPRDTQHRMPWRR